MRSLAPISDAGDGQGNIRRRGCVDRVVRVAAIILVVAFVLLVTIVVAALVFGPSNDDDSAATAVATATPTTTSAPASTPSPTRTPTATPASASTPTARPVEDAPVNAATQASVASNRVTEAASSESAPQREGDWEVRVREAVRVPELLGETPTTGDFVVVVFAATHIDDGQGRFDKAIFELHELRGDRIAKHDEQLSDRAAAELDMSLLGASVPEGSTAEFVVVFADVATASNRLMFRFDSNRLLMGSISFDLSRILGQSLTARLVALPRQEPTIAAAAALTPTSEPTVTPTPDPTPTSTPAPTSTPTLTPEPMPTPTPTPQPTSTPTPTPEPTPTPIPRTWTCPSGTVYDDSTRSCIRVSAERVSNREPSQTGSSPTSEYVVQAGDTLRSIAERFGTTIDSLMEANDIEDPDLIRTGSVLLVPAPATVVEDIVDDSESSLTAFPATRTSTSTPRPTPTPYPTSIQLSLTELLDEYDQNKVRANSRLRYRENGNLPVSTSGYISQVDEHYSTIAPTQDRYATQELHCYYADTRTALQITKGQFVSVTGRVSGSTEYSSDVNMYACQFEGIEFESNPVVSIPELRTNVVQVICHHETSLFGVISISSENRGTGVVIDPENGTILTVHHVIADENECKSIVVRLPGGGLPRRATTLKHCASIDRAVLRIDPSAIARLSFQPIYRSSAPAQVDQEVFFWGYGPGRIRMESGIVKEIWGDDVVMDAYAVPGDSGSPVFDENGHLLGTVSSGNRSDRTVFTGDEC